ncbi:MAG: cytochrome C oxidase subunit IV family protein [Pseudomonadota bacterium]
MNTTHKNYSAIVWLFLVFLTLFAFLLGWLELVNQLLVSLLLFTTYVKGNLVIDYFMELKHVQLKWRIIPIIWLLVVISLIAVAYYNPKIV